MMSFRFSGYVNGQITEQTRKEHKRRHTAKWHRYKESQQALLENSYTDQGRKK